jgi:hypothetical protein
VSVSVSVSVYCVGVNKRFMGTPNPRRRVSEPGLGDDPGNQVYYRVNIQEIIFFNGNYIISFKSCKARWLNIFY